MAFRLIAVNSKVQFGVTVCDIVEKRSLVFLFLGGTAQIDELLPSFHPVIYHEFFAAVGFAETACADDE